MNLSHNKQSIPIHDRLPIQCSIAGDVNGDLLLLHEVSDEGRFPEVFKRTRRDTLGDIFSDTQIAMVGNLYVELIQKGYKFVLGEVNFENQGHLRVMQVNKGLLRLYSDRDSANLLGNEMIGSGNEH